MKWSVALLLAMAAAAAAQAPSRSFDDLSQAAQQAYQAGKEEEAAHLFSDAVAQKPDWAEGWWAIGMIDYDLDRYEGCRDALTHMVALDAKAVPGWALLGLCEFRTKQYDLAFDHLKQAHMLVPAKETGGPLLDMANYHLAMLLTRKGAYELAQEVFVQVALKVQNNPDMEFAAGLAALRMPILPTDVPASQHDLVAMAGKALWDLTIKPPDVAETEFQALVKAYPNAPNVHYFYASFLGGRHPEQCASEYLAELRVDPDSVPARVQLARRYLVEGKNTEAFKYAQQAVSLSPDSIGAYLALAEVQQAGGDYAHALVAYQAAEKLDPISYNIRLYLANAYRAVGRAEDSRRELEEYRRLKAEQQNWP